MTKFVYLTRTDVLIVTSQVKLGMYYCGEIKNGKYYPVADMRAGIKKVQIMDELNPQELKALVECMKDVFFEERIDTEEAKEQSRFKFNFEEYKELVTEAVRAVTEAFPAKEKVLGPSPLQGMYKDWKKKQDIAMRKTEIPPTQTLTEAEIDYFAHADTPVFFSFYANHNYSQEDRQKTLDRRNQLFVEDFHQKKINPPETKQETWRDRPSLL